MWRLQVVDENKDTKFTEDDQEKIFILQHQHDRPLAHHIMFTE
jgi:hypothetical protein